MKPKISVLIPCYNHAKYISHTINSVLSQTFEDFELLLCDDCSPDNSKEVIDSFSDTRLKRVVLEKNVGVVRNLNNLILNASGEYIAILGSDDKWQRDKLEKQLAVLEQNSEFAACFTWADIIDENGKNVESCDFDTNIFNLENCSQSEWLKRFYETGNHLCHSSVLIRKSVHDELGLYNISLRQLHDYDMWIRLISKYPIFIINEKLTLYRRASENAKSISASNFSNKTRLYNETEHLLYNMIAYMPDNMFKDAFADESCEDSTDIAVQKLITLYGCNLGDIGYDMGNRYLFENSDAAFFDLLETKYKLNLNDVYEKTALGNITYPFEIMRIYSSSSWKLSKPIRITKNIINRIRRKNND